MPRLLSSECCVGGHDDVSYSRLSSRPVSLPLFFYSTASRCNYGTKSHLIYNLLVLMDSMDSDDSVEVSDDGLVISSSACAEPLPFSLN